tara:strand:+ start:2062 stop:3009 length:948 start_codon:yes stop_codon:yes gene_type:complete
MALLFSNRPIIKKDIWGNPLGSVPVGGLTTVMGNGPNGVDFGGQTNNDVDVGGQTDESLLSLLQRGTGEAGTQADFASQREEDLEVLALLQSGRLAKLKLESGEAFRLLVELVRFVGIDNDLIQIAMTRPNPTEALADLVTEEARAIVHRVDDSEFFQNWAKENEELKRQNEKLLEELERCRQLIRPVPTVVTQTQTSPTSPVDVAMNLFTGVQTSPTSPDDVAMGRDVGVQTERSNELMREQSKKRPRPPDDDPRKRPSVVPPRENLSIVTGGFAGAPGTSVPGRESGGRFPSGGTTPSTSSSTFSRDNPAYIP